MRQPHLQILILAIVAALGLPLTGKAQIVTLPDETLNTDSLRRAFADTHYYFGLYKDNYFIFGPAIGQRITRENTNIKFQISVAQKLTRNTLPWGTYLYLFYTQKVFWNVLEDSMPMTDLNFNPGIGLSKPLFVKNRYIGNVSLILEHESNGRDGEASRSWNKVSLAGSILVDPNFRVFAKYWIPIIDGSNNKDILRYCGIYQMGWSVNTPNRRFMATILLTKRQGWNLNYNFCIDLSWNISRKFNQYIFVQYYNGYGEGLLEYNKYHSQLRAGIVIKPNLFSAY